MYTVRAKQTDVKLNKGYNCGGRGELGVPYYGDELLNK